MKNIWMMFTKALIPFAFDSSLFLLAYMDVKFVGRIDSSAIFSHFDGSKKAYFDWICVIKSYRQKGIYINSPLVIILSSSV